MSKDILSPSVQDMTRERILSRIKRACEAQRVGDVEDLGRTTAAERGGEGWPMGKNEGDAKDDGLKEFSLPDVPLYEPKGDPVSNFIAKLESFDGKAVRVGSRGEALKWLATNLVTKGKQVYSSVPDFKGNFEVNEATDPHSAHVVDICVANGVLGVGETGSVWVTEKSLGLTACALFSTDLYLLLDTDKICAGLHQAYEMLDLAAGHYGAFYTGPSATADIEAVHITGAQGEISLTVILIG